MRRNAVLLGLVAIGTVAIACRPVPSPGPTESRLPPSAPTATAGDVSPAWSRLDLPQVGDTTEISALLADEAGFVLAGGVGGQPAAWSSSDATEWTAERLPGREGLTPTSGYTTDAGTVLLGGGGTENCAHPSTAMTWARPAGGEWAVAPFDEILCASPYVAQVASHGGGLVLAGTGFGEVALAWTSDDGLRWTDATPPGMVETSPRAVAWSGTEYVLLAIAEPGTDEWTSPDGGTWKRRPGALAIRVASASIVRVGDSLLAVIQGNGDAATTWHRLADGTWEPLAIPGLDPGIELRSALALGDRPLFLGALGGHAVVVAWLPGDPTATVVAGPDDAIDLVGLAVHGSTVVALGGSGTLDERRPAVWSAPASLLP